MTFWRVLVQRQVGKPSNVATERRETPCVMTELHWYDLTNIPGRVCWLRPISVLRFWIFIGFDWGAILIVRRGIPRPTGDFLESLSQAIWVDIILVGRLGASRVKPFPIVRGFQWHFQWNLTFQLYFPKACHLFPSGFSLEIARWTFSGVFQRLVTCHISGV